MHSDGHRSALAIPSLALPFQPPVKPPFNGHLRAPRHQRVVSAGAVPTIPPVERPRIHDKQVHVIRSTGVSPPIQQKQPTAPQPLPPQVGGRSSHSTQQGPNDLPSKPYIKDIPKLVLQPETRPISQEQLAAEVKGIYARLEMVEAKCVDVDNKQAKDAQEAEPGKQPKLNNEQWQALIALHRTLLHEHHDFFLASQHPSASPTLHRLTSKYAMPARMWRHGIHSFLELLRHRLPDSLEHMLSFIYLAHSMMAPLFETVPTFEDVWIECLGDLGRYRMAIEDDDIRDREVWTRVARFWYSKAADKSPTVGRLYHHLAILARPNALQQLYYYTRSLSCVQPFLSARESILTLFDPILCGTEPVYHRPLPVDTAFIKAHGILFTGVSLDRFSSVINQFLSLLDNNIGRVTSKWKEQGIYIAVAKFAALFGYASKDNLLRRVYTMEQSDIREVPQDAVSQHDVKTHPTESGPRDRTHSDPVGSQNVLPPAPVESNSESGGYQTALSKAFGGQQSSASGGVGAEDSRETSKDVTAFANAKFLTFATLDLALQRLGDPNTLPHVHISLVFINHIMHSEPAMNLVEEAFPWESLASILNTLVTSYDNFQRVENRKFPEPEKEVGRFLPNDFNIRGLVWAASYPDRWFENALVDNEERTLELASMAADREEHIVWLAYQLAQSCHSLLYDSESKTFSTAPDVKHMLDQAHGSLVGSGPFEQATSLTSRPTALHEVDMDTEVGGAGETDEVCDTNLFLGQPEIFLPMINNPGWSVVVPDSVITELNGLSRNQNSVGQEVKKQVPLTTPAGWHVPAKVETTLRSLNKTPIVSLLAFLGMIHPAFSLPTNNTLGSAANGWPSIPGAPPFSGWPYSLVCLLLAGYSCISLRYPSRSCLQINIGLMTALVDSAWMIIVIDGTLLPSTKWSTLLLGTFYTLMYGQLVFKKYHLEHGSSLAVISIAGLLNYLAVQFLPNQVGMGPRERLLQFLLPSVGFSLSFWAFIASKLFGHPRRAS
ncbi:MAG: hypothetical protein M1840_005243 [Geoglossum simile]|nr:MAG: hypothetical protein M1840_005243 [Geoglossum simile]